MDEDHDYKEKGYVVNGLMFESQEDYKNLFEIDQIDVKKSIGYIPRVKVVRLYPDSFYPSVLFKNADRCLVVYNNVESKYYRKLNKYAEKFFRRIKIIEYNQI